MRQLKSYYTEVILVFVFLCCLNVIAVIDGEKNKIMLKEHVTGGGSLENAITSLYFEHNTLKKPILWDIQCIDVCYQC